MVARLESEVGSLFTWAKKEDKLDQVVELLSSVVKKVEDGVATIDLNHPLAGKKLTFSLNLVACEAAPSVELTPKSKVAACHLRALGGEVGQRPPDGGVRVRPAQCMYTYRTQ